MLAGSGRNMRYNTYQLLSQDLQTNALAASVFFESGCHTWKGT